MNARSRIAASAATSAAAFTGYGDCALRMVAASSRWTKMQPRRSPARPAGLRKCARDDQISVPANPGNHGDAGKFEIGLVDHDHRPRRRVQNPLQLARAKAGCRSGCSDWAERIRAAPPAAPPAHCSTGNTLPRRSAAPRCARPPVPNRSDTSRTSARPAAPCRRGSTNVFTTRLSASSVPFVSSKSPRLDAEIFCGLAAHRFLLRDTPKSMQRSVSRARGGRRASSRWDSR